MGHRRRRWGKRRGRANREWLASELPMAGRPSFCERKVLDRHGCGVVGRQRGRVHSSKNMVRTILGVSSVLHLTDERSLILTMRCHMAQTGRGTRKTCSKKV